MHSLALPREFFRMNVFHLANGNCIDCHFRPRQPQTHEPRVKTTLPSLHSIAFPSSSSTKQSYGARKSKAPSKAHVSFHSIVFPFESSQTHSNLFQVPTVCNLVLIPNLAFNSSTASYISVCRESDCALRPPTKVYPPISRTNRLRKPED